MGIESMLLVAIFLSEMKPVKEREFKMFKLKRMISLSLLILVMLLSCQNFRALAQEHQLTSNDRGVMKSPLKIQDRVVTDESKKTIGVLPMFSGDNAALSGKLDAFCDTVYQSQIKKMKLANAERVFFGYKEYRYDERFLSLVIHASIDPGNTQSDEVHSIVFDLKSLKEVSLEDILGEDALARSNQWIKESIERSKDKGFFVDELNFNELAKKAAFYLDLSGNLVFVFDKYEIGPGALGTPEIRIPADQLLKHYSRLLVVDNGASQAEKGRIRVLQREGLLFLPLRNVATALSMTVDYNKKTSIITLEKEKNGGDLTVDLKTGERVSSRGAKIKWSTKFIIDQGHLFIPVEMLVSIFNCNVDMDQSRIVLKGCL